MVRSKKSNRELKSINFPRLMINKSSGKIVLMDDYGSGMVMLQGSSADPVGFYSNEWVMGIYENFDGEVTLNND